MKKIGTIKIKNGSLELFGLINQETISCEFCDDPGDFQLDNVYGGYICPEHYRILANIRIDQIRFGFRSKRPKCFFD